MNALTHARNAYAQTSTATHTPRGIEYQVIARVTHRLKSAAQKGDAGFAELAAAIADNRRLWTALAADVARSGNGLPEDLRARILYLAEFTTQHSRAVLDGRASAAPLLEVNSAVLRGLRQEAPQP
ncbi:flagellar biosynthesis regulator FlaF [Rhodosalinus sp. 5P4]|uniref:flagellar biosynthesis regulator FlaF n=1 Tax=Rhodosalinus sp. 5P4 TaxID=3239196 RepID=UPI003525F11F